MAMTSLAVDDRLRDRDRVALVLPRWLTMIDTEMSDRKGSQLTFATLAHGRTA